MFALDPSRDYTASLAHIELAGDEFQSREWEGDFQALKDMLTFIQGRWTLAGEWLCRAVLEISGADKSVDAGKFLDNIQEAYDQKVRERNTVARESPVMKNRAQWRSSVGI